MDKAFLSAAVVLVTLQHQGAAISCYNCISTIQPQCKWKYTVDHFLLVPAPTNSSVCYMSRQKVTTDNITMYIITRGFLYGIEEAMRECAEIETADASNLCQYCSSGDGCNWKKMIASTTPVPYSGASPTAIAILTIAAPILSVIT